jgi:hypothetical protein
MLTDASDFPSSDVPGADCFNGCAGAADAGRGSAAGEIELLRAHAETERAERLWGPSNETETGPAVLRRVRSVPGPVRCAGGTVYFSADGRGRILDQKCARNFARRSPSCSATARVAGLAASARLEFPSEKERNVNRRTL